MKKQLTTEVENKKTTIGNLSKELEIHQKNFIELKEELSKVITCNTPCVHIKAVCYYM